MPQLTVEGYGTFDVADGKRLVLALEQDAGVDQMHACGGYAKCTTCRVEFVEGEPDSITEAEKKVLAERDVEGARLSCQILCDHDMSVRAISRMADFPTREDPGPEPEESITPDPVWVDA